MKRVGIIRIIALCALASLLLCGCIVKPLSEEEVLAEGQKLYTAAEKMCDWNSYVFELYDESELIVKYKIDDEYFFKISNYDDIKTDLLASDVLVGIKQAVGLRLTKDSGAYVLVRQEPSLYDHSELAVTEITAERITFTVTAYYYSGWAEKPENNDADPTSYEAWQPDFSLWVPDGEPTNTQTYSFVIARAYNEIENEKGKTEKEYFWYVLEFTCPF